MFLLGGGKYNRGDESGGLGMKNPYKKLRHWRWKRKVNRAIHVLDELDWSLKSQDWRRAERRRFWEEFHRNPRSRTAILNKMTQE